MLSAIVFGRTPALINYLRQICAEFPDICIYKIVDSFPKEHAVMRLLNSYEPDIVFFEVDPDEHAVAFVESIWVHSPGTALVGIGQRWDDPQVREVVAAGVTQVLVPPFTGEKFLESVTRSLDHQRQTPKGDVLAFVPAKPGSGATVTALNVASSLALTLKQRVLLLEADYRTGSLAALLSLKSVGTAARALENDRMDDPHWGQAVREACGIGVLPAPGVAARTELSRWHYWRVLRFARSRYDLVVADLGELGDPGVEGLLAEAAAVHLVCTPERASLWLLDRRLRELEQLGVAGQKVRVVVNRHTKGDPAPAELEGAIGRSVWAILPEDIQSLRSAGRAAGVVDASSVFGKSVAALAARSVGMPVQSDAREFSRWLPFWKTGGRAQAGRGD